MIFVAPAHGWYIALVEKATFVDGLYDLTIALLEPTATPTPTPTATPTITPSPTTTPTATPTITQSPTPLSQPYTAVSNPPAATQPAMATPIVGAPEATASLTTTAPITATTPLSLTVQYLGRAQPPASTATTYIRLLVYYDANNDRQPGPGEGIASVSVLAVDTRGQRIARVFTNAQGEAIFNLTSEVVARVIVPFVPGWSARIRVGETNNDIVLGLPAVRLPVFLPVQKRVGE
jgi:hypothetical protein